MLKPEELKQYAITGAIGVGVLGIGTALLVKAIRQGREKRADAESVIPGSPAYYAGLLHSAFDNDMMFGWGTDEQAVYKVMRAIPNATTLRQVYAAYFNLYREQLGDRLRDELTTAQYNMAMQYLTANKPNYNR